MCRRVAICLAAWVVLSAWSARAGESIVMYKDKNWGVVQQNNGRTCIVVLNTDDRRHAFHFLIDGENRIAQLGILQEFLPDSPSPAPAKVRISLELGSDFVQQFDFEPESQNGSKLIAAVLTRRDLDRILTALEETPTVNVSFANGESWHVHGPEKSAAPAIDRCWKTAVTVMRDARF